MKIGLALSGGGFRATVFHLGVLSRLAHSGHLEDVTFLSTVSGGSLCIALVHALNDFQWPSSSQYREKILPEVRRLLTTEDLQRRIITRSLLNPWTIFRPRSDHLSALMKEHWGLTASLRDLPSRPRWMINATCYESGKNWRFERFRMGDYLFGYSYDTADVPLSDAVTASAGFPGLIGAMTLDATRYSWFKYTEKSGDSSTLAEPAALQALNTEPVQPLYPQAHLWDGGVYDNHGLEGIHDFIKGWRADVNFFIISDGAGKSKPEEYRAGIPAMLRIATGIMMDQIRSLRARAILERFINHKDEGSFLRAGNSCRYVLKAASLPPEEVERICSGCLSEEEARRAGDMPTVIRRLTQDEFERLYRHGFEVADYTLYGYNADKFEYVGYANAR